MLLFHYSGIGSGGVMTGNPDNSFDVYDIFALPVLSNASVDWRKAGKTASVDGDMLLWALVTVTRANL